MVPQHVIDALKQVEQRVKTDDGRQALATLIKEIEAGTFATGRYDGLDVNTVTDLIFSEVRRRVMAKRDGGVLASHGLVAGEEFLMPSGEKALYADFGSRLAAWLIDWAILGTGSFILMAGVMGAAGRRYGNVGPEVAATTLLLLIGYWLYYALQESSPHQGTVGKRALKIIVVNRQGERLSFGNATGRFFSRLVTRLLPVFLGYLMMLWTEKKQALHDMMAGTFVLKKEPANSNIPQPAPTMRSGFDG